MASYLGIITPTNLAAEKERFFSSNNYSPQLEYNWSRQTIDRFIQKTPKGKPLVDAMLSQDGMAITAAASNFFDVKFRENDLKFAQELIAHTPISSNGTAEAYAQLMRQKLASLDIDYSVEVVDQHGFQARPNHKKRVLKISKVNAGSASSRWVGSTVRCLAN